MATSPRNKLQHKLYYTESAYKGDPRFISSSEIVSASESFNNGAHINKPAWINNPSNLSIIYQMKLMEEDIDEIRRYTVDDKTMDMDGGLF